MQTVVVGDIHGRLDITRAFLEMAGDDTQVVFVGDFLDSFDRSPEDQVECLLNVLHGVRTKNVLACKGNHEISYLDPNKICSGWSQVTQSLVDSIGRSTIEDSLLDSIWIEPNEGRPILISHAGVSAAHFDKPPEHITPDDVKEFLENSPILGSAGYSRGGSVPVGGIFWCDWWREFDPIPSIRQIVGHSNYRPKGAHTGVVTKGSNYNIDCLGRGGSEYVVINDRGSISVEKLGE